MKRLLITGILALSSSADGHEIKCPEFYPQKESKLAEIPTGRNGSGLLRGSNLSSAFIYEGELHSDPSMNQPMQESYTRVKGGWDMGYTFAANDSNRWLVCVYGGDRDSVERPRLHGQTEWWEKINSNNSSCVLKFRELKGANQARSTWAATAVCG